MNAPWWINTDQHMDVLGHDLHAFDDGLMLLTDLPNDLLQGGIHPLDKNLAALFGTPDHLVVAAKRHKERAFHPQS
jgi:hypothetical protein